MNKKRWTFSIVCILLGVAWYKLFYKTWNTESVPKSADCVIAVDVKKITNTLIWNFLTTPSQWNTSNFFSSEKGKVSWDDMVKIPDYIFIFHNAGEASKIFYAVLEIKDASDFAKGLLQYHFEKDLDGSYFSTAIGLRFIKNGNKILVSNTLEKTGNLSTITNELFIKKNTVDKESLQKNIAASAHLSIQLLQNDYVKSGQIITAGFDEESIFADTDVDLDNPTLYPNNKFSFSDSNLLTLGFIQPNIQMKTLLNDSIRAKFSTALNFNIDSVFLPSNTYYQLNLEGIHSRIDSAVSYTYDDDFNPVAKVIVNNVEEPSLNFSMAGDSVQTIFNYWQNAGKIEKTSVGNLFTPVPFVKSYCNIDKEKHLEIVSNNYKAAVSNRSVECMLFLQVTMNKVPEGWLHYLPQVVQHTLTNIASAEATVTNKKGKAVVHFVFHKKKNDLPLFSY
jgi:hypothetical protein